MLISTPRELALMIIDRRKKLKLSQAQVADLVGLKQKTISLIENKPEAAKLSTLFQVLSAIELDMHFTPKNKKSSAESKWKQEW